MRRLAIAMVLAAGCAPAVPSAVGVERTAAAAGAPAPASELVGVDGGAASLTDTFARHRATVVVFYRGFY